MRPTNHWEMRITDAVNKSSNIMYTLFKLRYFVQKYLYMYVM